jgi:hypothetical protein
VASDSEKVSLREEEGTLKNLWRGVSLVEIIDSLQYLHNTGHTSSAPQTERQRRGAEERKERSGEEGLT